MGVASIFSSFTTLLKAIASEFLWAMILCLSKSIIPLKNVNVLIQVICWHQIELINKTTYVLSPRLSRTKNKITRSVVVNAPTDSLHNNKKKMTRPVITDLSRSLKIKRKGERQPCRGEQVSMRMTQRGPCRPVGPHPFYITGTKRRPAKLEQIMISRLYIGSIRVV